MNTKLLVAFAAGAAIAWGVQSLRLQAVEVTHAQFAAEVERDAARSAVKAAGQSVLWLKQKEKANEEARKREAALETELAGVRRADRGLRNAITTLRRQLADASLAAAVESADTLGELFDACSAEYQDVAAAAQRHAEDVRNLDQSWPSSGNGEATGERETE